jgi:hypothetical protein
MGELARHRGPGRVRVDPGLLEAEQARAPPRLNERADPNLPVAEHDRKVWHVPPQPATVARRLDRESADEHREGRRRRRRGIRFSTPVGAGVVEVVGGEPEVVEEGAQPRGRRAAPVDGDPAPRRRRSRPCFGAVEEDRTEGVKEGVHGLGCGAAAAAEHDGAGAGHSRAESVDDALEAGPRHGDPENRAVDAELDRVRGAPDERIPGVDSKSHAPMMPDSPGTCANHPQARQAPSMSPGNPFRLTP